VRLVQSSLLKRLNRWCGSHARVWLPFAISGYSLLRVTVLLRKILASLVLLPTLAVGVACPHGSCIGYAQSAVPPAINTATRTNFWELAILKFEEEDKVNPPKPGGVVFTGSSSIAHWKTLAEDMKGVAVINRGFGGSQYSDLNEYARRIVIAYRPAAVVVYEGDNDLAAESSKTPELVARDAEKFVQIVHSALPETWIYILSIKPSKARFNEWSRMKTANGIIREFAGTQQRVQYIDIAISMLDAQEHVPDDLFVADGLHPNAKCYALWTSIIKPVLLKRFAGSG
jgi:lysophospholipase L1-like esterase